MPLAVLKTFLHVSEEELAADEITNRRRKGRAQTTGAFRNLSSFEEAIVDEAEGMYEFRPVPTESTSFHSGAASLQDESTETESPLYVVSTARSDVGAADSKNDLVEMEDMEDDVGKV